MKYCFNNLLRSTKRKNIERLINWLEYQTDFYTAPASAKYHGDYVGGLLEHSMAVCYNMLKLDSVDDYDSIVITSLLHDICKANFYEKYQKNVKENGIWVQKDAYKINEIYPFGGHGSKSVYLIMSNGVLLFQHEAVAINCHMGGWDYTIYHNPSQAFQKYPLAAYLHMADFMSTYISGV